MERTTSEAHRIAVLTGGHGRGSNLRAIHQHFESLGFPARVELVVGDRMDTPVKDLCLELGLRYEYASSKDMRLYEAQLLRLVEYHRIELIALAGFLKLLSSDLLDRLAIPVLNIHPALIPKHCGKGMYGMKVHQAVFAAGEKFSGATVHIVDPVYDHGRIVIQKQTDISDCTSPEEIAARVLSLEHSIYAPAIMQILQESHS